MLITSKLISIWQEALGRLYYNSGNYDKALELFERKLTHALDSLSMAIFFFKIQLLVIITNRTLDGIDLIYGLVAVLLAVDISALETHFMFALQHNRILAVDAHLFVANGTLILVCLHF